MPFHKSACKKLNERCYRGRTGRKCPVGQVFNNRDNRDGVMPGYLLHQYMIKCSGVFIRFRFYLQETAVYVFNGKSGAMLCYRSFIFSIMVREELVYKCPGGSIKYKYPQQHDSQYPI